MNDHQLWLDSLNYHQQRGLTLAQAAEQCSKWPFKYVNGQQTAASVCLQTGVSLENTPQAKPLEGYDLALTEVTEEAML
jgi:hypothetical protein